MTPKTALIDPPRRLGQKVQKTGGPTPEIAILSAVNAADDLMNGYQGWAVDDLEALWNSFRNLAGRDEIEPVDIKEMFDIAHEVRGHGGSFGFPLISLIGDSLCKFIDGRSRLDNADLGVVQIHIMALKAVFRQNLKGPCGELSTVLPELLHALRARA